MKKYIPYVVSAIIISALISILSYIFSGEIMSKSMMLIVSTVGTIMIVTIICLIGRILEDKNTLLVKVTNDKDVN